MTMIDKIVEVFGETASATVSTYNFKSRKVTNPDGSTTVIPARAPVNLTMPVPTLAGLIEIINAGGAGATLLLDVAADAVYDFAKANLLDLESFNPEDYDPALLAWNAIATAPREDGRRGISKERWTEFKEDYCAVMLQVSGLSKVQVENAAKFFVQKLAPVRTMPARLERLRELLGVYMQNSANADSQVCEYLLNKIEEFLNAEEAPVEDVLG